MKENVIKNKSFDFALRVVRLTRALVEGKREYVMSKQLLKSATSIGANVRESEYAQSRPDFIHKMSIALKEANETDYWLDLLFHADIIEKTDYESLKSDLNEIISLLVSIVKTSKGIGNEELRIKSGELRVEN